MNEPFPGPSSPSSSARDATTAPVLAPGPAAIDASTVTNGVSVRVVSREDTPEQASLHCSSSCPILRALEVSLVVDDGARTVCDFWERHEKKIPCAAVVEVLQNQDQHEGQPIPNHRRSIPLHRELLHLASVELLHNYLAPLKKAFTSTTATSPLQRTSVFYMESVSVCIRFLQLVLEYQEAVEPNQDDTATATSTPIKTLSMIGDPDIQDLVLRLIRSLIGTMCSILEYQGDMDNNIDNSNNNMDPTNSTIYTLDCRSTLHRQPIAAFAWGELLKLQHHYVPTRPFLLVPLGKAVCEMAEALGSQQPRPMLQYAIDTCLQLLEEGLHTTTTTATKTTTLLTPLTVKIFGFVLARWTVLWNLMHKQSSNSNNNNSSNNNEVLQRSVHVLMQLRRHVDLQESDNNAAHDDKSNLRLKPLRNKIEKCWTAAAAAMGPRVAALLLQRNSKNDQNNKAEIPVPWVLQHLDEQCRGVDNPIQDLDSILRLVEDVVFRGLPRTVCRANKNTRNTPLLERSLDIVSDTLWRCEWQLQAERGRLHQLMVHWLSALSSSSSQAHPLSREIVLELLTRHARKLTAHQAAEPLVRLCVRLLFDVRTVTQLRAGLVSLIGEQRWWRTDPILYQQVQAVVCTEFAALQKSLRCRRSSNKRKHRDDNDNDKRSPRVAHSAPDLLWILHLLSSTKVSGVDYKNNENDILCDLVSGKAYWSASQVYLAALLTTIDNHSNSSGGNIDNNNKNEYATLLSQILSVWTDRRPTMSRGQVRSLMVLSVAVLRRAHRVILQQQVQLTDHELTKTTRFLNVCLNAATTSTYNDNGLQSYKDLLIRTPLVLEGIRVLGVLGEVITPQSTPAPLQIMTKCFQILLSSQQPWITHAYTLAALQQVASRLPSVHQNVLKQCLPKALTPWFRARLQGTAFVHGTSASLSDLETQLCAALLHRLHGPCCSDDEPILPDLSRRSAEVLPNGSYVLKMPTQAGRHALVVFPPGAQSMDDIRYMLGMENDDDLYGEDDEMIDGPNLRILQNGSPLPCGGIKLKMIIKHSSMK